MRTPLLADALLLPEFIHPFVSLFINAAGTGLSITTVTALVAGKTVVFVPFRVEAFLALRTNLSAGVHAGAFYTFRVEL